MHKAVTTLVSSVLVAASVVVVPSASTPRLCVGTAGDDAPSNPCTEVDAPCLTVSGAVARAQTAITSGADDVTVNIAAGTYPENVDIGTVDPGHSLSLVGDAAATTIIHGLGTDSAPASVISIAGGVVDLSGLSITGGYAARGRRYPQRCRHGDGVRLHGVGQHRHRWLCRRHLQHRHPECLRFHVVGQLCISRRRHLDPERTTHGLPLHPVRQHPDWNTRRFGPAQRRQLRGR